MKILKKKSSKIPKAKPMEKFHLSIPKDYSLNDGLTQSLITEFDCRYKFLYKLNRWESDTKWKNVGFGSLVHDILDKIYSHGRIGGTTINGWIDSYDFGQKPSPELELLKTKASVLLGEYVKYYTEDFSQKKFTDVETVFDVKFRGIRLRGKIDARYKVGGKVWIMETKTKSQINEADLLLSLTFDFQNLFYILCDTIRTKEPVAGILYNIIRAPQSKPLKNEKLSDYAKRLKKEVQKDPAYYFKRFEIPYGDKDKEEFMFELTNILWEITQFLGGHLSLYRQRKSCYGRYKCEFLQLCATHRTDGYHQKKKMFMELD